MYFQQQQGLFTMHLDVSYYLQEQTYTLLSPDEATIWPWSILWPIPDFYWKVPVFKAVSKPTHDPFFAILILMDAITNFMSFFLCSIYVKSIIDIKEEIVGCGATR